MLSFADIATQLNTCKTMALALPNFYKKTGISAQLTFKYDTNQNIEIMLGFSPREPNENEYSMLIEILFDSEKLIYDEQVINESTNYETLNQMIFKHREEMKQIIAKNKEHD